MIVLHATQVLDEFLLWGETATNHRAELLNFSADVPSEATLTHAQQIHAPAPASSKTSVAWLPGLAYFAAPYSVLRDALAESPGSLMPARKQNAQATLTLPTLNDTPLASTSLIGPSCDELSEQEVEQVCLQPWVVPVIRLTPAQMIELLCYCIDQDRLSAGVMAGQDLQYWSIALRFAGNLINKQQFLPGLRIDSQGAFGCWEPVFIGDDGDKLARLAQGMPMICLAGSAPALGECSRIGANDLLVRFLAKCIDFLVRKSYADKAISASPAGNDTTAANRQLHARWLTSLLSEDTKLPASSEEIAGLCSQIAEWRRPLEIASDSPYRLCFRLEEPDELEQGSEPEPQEQLRATAAETGQEDRDIANRLAGQDNAIQTPKSGWFVRFLLQSVKEPSLVLPVQTVLSPAFEELQLLRGGTVSAREYLFRSLGQAVRLYPRIAESFNERQPLGIQLDTNQAYDFLANKSVLLKNAGFSIQLPSWWSSGCNQVSVGISVKSSSGLFNLDQLAEFDWQVALGGTPISPEEIERLRQLKLPLVCISGRWTELNPDRLAAALSFVGDKQSKKATARELLKRGLGEIKLPDGIKFDGLRGGGPICDMLSALRGQRQIEPVCVHPRFAGRLRPYQEYGLSWLHFLSKSGLGACLADDMGLGKTVQTLAFIQRNWYRSNEARPGPTLLVCPTSLLGNWLREAEQFTPDLPVLVHHGSERARGASLQEAAAEAALVLTTYNLLQKDFEDLRKVKWDTIVLDEAQNIKNPNARQSQAAYSLKSRFRIALSGTPVENSINDIWSLMHFLNPGLLGRHSDFYERYFVPIQIFGDEQKIQQLRALTSPFVLRRLKTDKNILPELPSKVERKTTCTLTKEQAALYMAVAADATAGIDEARGIKRRQLVLTTLLRLKQICDHPALIVPDQGGIANRSGKLKTLTSMLKAVIDAGERALVFTQFTGMGALIQKHLQETFATEILFLHGGTERANRERLVSRFQMEDGGPPVFVLSLKAGGSGLNLTRANHVFHFDRWWNPAVEEQATDRAFRFGQLKDVQVHKLICAGTFEERIDEIIDSKKYIADSMIGAGEAWITEMSTDQLRDVFSLRNTALVD